MKRFTTPLIVRAAGAATLLGSHPAQAHGSAASGVLGGLTHPLFGLDHLFMLMAVGAAASFFSARLLLWAAVGAIAGAAAGAWGVQVPAAEVWAALAVAALGGLLLALAGRNGSKAGSTGAFPPALGALCGPLVAAGVAIHALLHGQEAPADGSTLLWWSGAMLSSILVCGGTCGVFQRLPQVIIKGAAMAFLVTGGCLALASLALLAEVAAG